MCSHVMNKTNSTEQKGSPNSHRNSPDRFKVSCLKTSLYDQRDFSTRNYGVRTRDGLDMNVPSCKEKVGEEMVYLFFKKQNAINGSHSLFLEQLCSQEPEREWHTDVLQWIKT